MAGLPYSPKNTRLLLRALLYSCGKENEYALYQATNPSCEVHAYPEKGLLAVLNNSQVPQDTGYYDGKGRLQEVHLEAGEMQWHRAEKL